MYRYSLAYIFFTTLKYNYYTSLAYVCEVRVIDDVSNRSYYIVTVLSGAVILPPTVETMLLIVRMTSHYATMPWMVSTTRILLTYDPLIWSLSVFWIPGYPGPPAPGPRRRPIFSLGDNQQCKSRRRPSRGGASRGERRLKLLRTRRPPHEPRW
jgi:hypothetical protein